MSTRVYLGGLSYRARERDVEHFFRKYGRLREISLKNGFAFCEFEDYRDADDACHDLNGKEFMGERVSVEIAKGTPHGRDRDRWGTGPGGSGRRSRSRSPRGRGRDRRDSRDGRGRPVWLDKYGPPTRTDYRLTVENLSSRVSWQDLKDYMRQAGDVTYADAHKNRRNEGCVEFGSYKDLQTALDKLDGTELNGRRIKLIEEKSGRGRSRSRSGGRGGSRSRSRSPRRDRSRSKSRSRSKGRGDRGGDRSRSRDRGRTRSRSGEDDRNRRDRSRSKDGGEPEAKRARSASRSRSPRDRRDRSRSASRSPGRRQDDSRGGDRDDKSDRGDKDDDTRPPGDDDDQ